MRQYTFDTVTLPCLVALVLVGFGLTHSHSLAESHPTLAPAPRESAPPLVIERISVIDTEKGVARTNQTVLIRGSRIEAVVPSEDFAGPQNASRIDGRGLYLIPGLWDMHVHVVHEKMRSLFLANGVTGVRHMFSVHPLYPARRLSAKWTRGPRLVGTDTIVDGIETPFPLLVRGNVLRVKNASDAERAVRAGAAGGNDCVKVYGMLDGPSYRAVCRAAKKHDLPVVGHVPLAVTAAEASDAGQASMEHLTAIAFGCARASDGLDAELSAAIRKGTVGGLEDVTAWRLQLRALDAYDPHRATELFAKFARNHTWQVPTLTQIRAWAEFDSPEIRFDPRIAFLPAELRIFWKVESVEGGWRQPDRGFVVTPAVFRDRKALVAGYLRLVREMHRAGVPLLAGTDTPNPFCMPGFSLHEELELLVKAGLTPAEALRTATSNPARFLGRTDIGTIAPGCLADLVLLEANPLDDIRNTRSVNAVVFNGQVLTRETLFRLTTGEVALNDRSANR